MAERCPRCGLPSERGEGYRLGAIAINLGATEAAFGLLLVVGALLTSPHVPWIGLAVAGIALNAVFPIAFYPFSKTIFLAIDLSLIHASDRTWRAEDELPSLPPGHRDEAVATGPRSFRPSRPGVTLPARACLVSTAALISFDGQQGRPVRSPAGGVAGSEVGDHEDPRTGR